MTGPRVVAIEENSFQRAQEAFFQRDSQVALILVGPALFDRDALEVLEASSLRKTGSKSMEARKKVLFDLRQNRAFLSKSLGEALRSRGISKFSVGSKEVVFEEVGDQEWTAFLAQLAALLELPSPLCGQEDLLSKKGFQAISSEKRSKSALTSPFQQAGRFPGREEAFSSSEKLQEEEKQALESARKREKEHLRLMQKRDEELRILKEELKKQLFFLGFREFAAA